MRSAGRTTTTRWLRIRVRGGVAAAVGRSREQRSKVAAGAVDFDVVTRLVSSETRASWGARSVGEAIATVAKSAARKTSVGGRSWRVDQRLVAESDTVVSVPGGVLWWRG